MGIDVESRVARRGWKVKKAIEKQKKKVGVKLGRKGGTGVDLRSKNEKYIDAYKEKRQKLRDERDERTIEQLLDAMDAEQYRREKDKETIEKHGVGYIKGKLTKGI